MERDVKAGTFSLGIGGNKTNEGFWQGWEILEHKRRIIVFEKNEKFNTWIASNSSETPRDGAGVHIARIRQGCVVASERRDTRDRVQVGLPSGSSECGAPQSKRS